MKNLKFVIDVISLKPETVWGISSHWGEITIGDFSERFVIPLDSWTLKDYYQQWLGAAERIKTYNVSCFVISAQNLMMNKDTYTLVETWTIYKEGGNVFVHNNLFNGAMLLELNLFNFDVKSSYQLVESYHRERFTADGEKISEWAIYLDDVISWLENKKHLY